MVDNYKWYVDKNKIDKIGINNDGSELMHDSMLYKLKKFKKQNINIKNIRRTQLIYKLDNTNGYNTDNKKNFTDLIFGEKSIYVIFEYIEKNKIMDFSHIVFNGKMFS